MGDLYRLQGEFAKAEPLLKQALAMRQKEYGEQHWTTARSLQDLGLLYFDQGHYSEAEPLLRKSLQIRESVLQPEDPNITRGLDSLARLLTAQGKYAEAEPLFQRAVSIGEKWLPPERLAQVYENYAGLLTRTGREPLAGEMRDRAAARRTQMGA